MRYRRDVPRDDQAAIDAETEHVIAHLSACCDPDDDETALADQITVEVTDHVDRDPTLVSITGEIDADPDADYLRDDYVPDDGDPADDGLPAAADRAPLDLDPADYEAHMADKEARS